MKPRVNILTLGVTNLERSIQFYEQGLGLPRLPFEETIAFFQLAGTWQALYPWDDLALDAVCAGGGKRLSRRYPGAQCGQQA